MKVTFYKLANGYVQTDRISKIENLTKAELIKKADLRHPVLTALEFYNVQSTDIHNKPRQTFTLFSKNNEYLIITR